MDTPNDYYTKNWAALKGVALTTLLISYKIPIDTRAFINK